MAGVQCAQSAGRQQLLAKRVAGQVGPLVSVHRSRIYHPLQQSHCPHAVRKDQGIDSGLDPMLEAAVPADQRPVNELASLKQSMMYNWVGIVLLMPMASVGHLVCKCLQKSTA
jgi:hypothetical protein